MLVAVYAPLTTIARFPRWKSIAGAFSVALALLADQPLRAQLPPVHYRHHAAMPPGAIGSWQLQRGGPIAGYYQPVQLRSPSGAKVALAAQGRFTQPEPGVTAGFLIGQVYRLRVTEIPHFPGEEVFPTLEVIDRTYPPPGFEARYPIVVEINHNDLELALQGRFVTRVIYVENPDAAFPVRENPHMQEWFDVRPGDDPLQVADAMGRPVAILRMGGRTPSNISQPDMRFLYGCPPYLPLPQAAAAPGAFGPDVAGPGASGQGPVAPPGTPQPPANGAPLGPPGTAPPAQPEVPPMQPQAQPMAPQAMQFSPAVQPRPPIENSALLPVQFRREARVLR